MFLPLSVILFTVGGGLSQHAMGQGCVSQHAMGQGVCIPACNWAGGGVCIPACNGAGGMYPSIQLGRGCVSQHAIGQGFVCVSQHAIGQGVCDQGCVCVCVSREVCLTRGVYTPHYGQQACGMHPSGMRSCY